VKKEVEGFLFKSGREAAGGPWVSFFEKKMHRGGRKRRE